MLVSGGVVAQIFQLMLAPIVASLYSPSEFGEFAIINSISMILVYFVTMKYESAIVMSDEDERDTLVQGMMWLGVIICSIVSIGIYIYMGNILNTILITLNLLMMSMKLMLLNVCNSIEEYKVYSFSKVVNQIGISIITILVAGSKYGLNGLIVGLFLGNVISNIYIYKIKEIFNFKKEKF